MYQLFFRAQAIFSDQKIYSCGKGEIVSFLLFFCLQLERAGINAETLPTFPGTIGKHVSQVPTAILALYFRALHAMAQILNKLDVFGVGRIGEAWPSRSRVKFRLRAEKLGATSATVEHALILALDILTCERHFSSLLSKDSVLIGGKFFLPILFGFVHFFHAIQW